MRIDGRHWRKPATTCPVPEPTSRKDSARGKYRSRTYSMSAMRPWNQKCSRSALSTWSKNAASKPAPSAAAGMRPRIPSRISAVQLQRGHRHSVAAKRCVQGKQTFMAARPARRVGGLCEDATPRLGRHLLVDPRVGFPHPRFECDRRRPAEALPNQCVVAVAATHTLRCVELVAAYQSHAGDRFDDVHQLVDGHELLAADVQRLGDIAPHQTQRPFQAIVDIGEASRLLPVSPNLDLT